MLYFKTRIAPVILHLGYTGGVEIPEIVNRIDVKHALLFSLELSEFHLF